MENTKTIPGAIVSARVDNKPLQSPKEEPLAPRPLTLRGRTYRLETPLSERSLYITINDVVEDGVRRPFEMFINTRSTEHFQWIVALTMVTSAVLRRSRSPRFLVDEFKGVHDPRGGYPTKGGYVPSLVAEIGRVLEEHLDEIEKGSAE